MPGSLVLNVPLPDLPPGGTGAYHKGGLEARLKTGNGRHVGLKAMLVALEWRWKAPTGPVLWGYAPGLAESHRLLEALRWIWAVDFGKVENPGSMAVRHPDITKMVTSNGTIPAVSARLTPPATLTIACATTPLIEVTLGPDDLPPFYWALQAIQSLNGLEDAVTP